MFAINQFNFTEENICYFSNINHLAKDVRKYFVFLANREKQIFEDLDKIKHTQLLQAISKAFGLPHYSKECNTLIVDLDFLHRLYKSVSEYILEKTKIKECFIVEVFNLLLLNVKNTKVYSLKSSVMKKLNLRIGHLERFDKLDMYSNKKMTKKQKILNESYKNLITEEDYELFQEFFYGFKFCFDYYKQVINKSYHFVWYPYALENYNYYFSFSKIEEYEEMLVKAKVYKYFIEIKYLLQDWIMASNIGLFNVGNIEETYYVQKGANNSYVELLLIDYEIRLYFHGGGKFARTIVGPSPLIDLKHEYLKTKYGDKVMLKKLTWEYSDYCLINVHTYTTIIEFCCGTDFIGFSFSSPNGVFSKCFMFNQVSSSVECLSHFGKNCYKTKDMKNFFLFKRENYYFEYLIFNGENLIYTVQFKMGEFIIKTPTKKVVMQYEYLLKEESYDLEI